MEQVARNLTDAVDGFLRRTRHLIHDRVVLLSEGHLRLVVHEYVEHYHCERNPHGLDNQLLERAPPPANPDASVHRRERLGGLLNYYHREVP